MNIRGPFEKLVDTPYSKKRDRHCTSTKFHLITPSRNFMEMRWRSLFRKRWVHELFKRPSYTGGTTRRNKQYKILMLVSYQLYLLRDNVIPYCKIMNGAKNEIS